MAYTLVWLVQMKDLIKNGVDFNQKFNKQIDDQHDGMSPLALACALQKKDFVQVTSLPPPSSRPSPSLINICL